MQLIRLVRILIIPLIFFTLILGSYAEDEYNENDEDDIITIESDWASANFGAYSKGDQIFFINLGMVKPLFFISGETGYLDSNMGLGGMGALGYIYFLNAHFFLGGELSGMFCSTKGKNMYFIIPIGFKAGYQFVVKRFEFPLALMVGLAPQTHSDLSYLGFFSKITGSAYFRFNAEWSFGLNTGFWWVPQWTSKRRTDYNNSNSNVNIHGFFLEFGLGARYHF